MAINTHKIDTEASSNSARSLFAHVTLIGPPAPQAGANSPLPASPFHGGLVALDRARNGVAILQQAVLADELAIKGGRPGVRAL